MYNLKLTQWFLLMSIINFFSETGSELLFVNVLLRHADRTPIVPYETYPKDPYKNISFDPPGRGMLTENGETRAFNSGRFCRKNYEHFLSINYSDGTVEARSTDFNRTKESLNLFLKALYPEASIPISFNPLLNDTLLYPSLCALYGKKFSQVENLIEVRTKMSDLEDFRKNLSIWTGKEIKSPLEMSLIFGTLEIQKFLNLTLPPWTEGVYPGDDFLKAIDLHFEVMNYDEEMRRLHGGMLIRKFIEDMDSVKNGTMEKNRKIMLYCAHDTNIIAVLKALNLYYAHAPQYSSAVIVELHLINEIYYVKVFYQLGVPEELVQLQIPGCDMLCPFEEFKNLSKRIIPSDYERLNNCKNT